MYEGQVPLHQRLVLLTQDFLESTWDFELNDLFNFQGSLLGLDKNIKRERAEKLEKIIKELFKKYQIEVIQPNLEYIINKFQTAYEEYLKEHANGKASQHGLQQRSK